MRTNTNPHFILSFKHNTFCVTLTPVDAASLLSNKPSYNIYIDSTPFGKLVFTNEGWRAPQFIPQAVVDRMIKKVKANCSNNIPAITLN